MNSPTLVEVRSLSKSFGSFTALKNINLDIRRGEILTLLGPSGCGKSTLMRIVAGFDSPTSGELLLDGRDMLKMPPERRPVNMVFQRYALFPHLDVYDNIAFGLRLKRLPECEIRDRVRKIIELVQLGPMADRWISEISGGQAQRVALARALVNEPEVLLLDEPLAALDVKIRQLMLAELKRIQETMGTTFVYVTHDQDEAMLLSSRIALMDHGRLVQLGTPDDIYFRPNSMFSARFLGETNVIDGVVAEIGNGRTLVAHGSEIIEASCEDRRLSVGDRVNVLVRPEAIIVKPYGEARPANAFRGRLTSVVHIGGKLLASAEISGGTAVKFLKNRLSSEQKLSIGDDVAISFSSDVVSLLPKED